MTSKRADPELNPPARRSIAGCETLTLSEADRQVFFEALIDPPEPSERLKRAAAKRKRRLAPQ